MSIPEPPVPTPGPGPEPNPTYVPGYAGYLVPRYGCNVAVVEEMSVPDLIHEVLFVSSRMYMSQGDTGKIRLKNKRPVSWALDTGGWLAGATQIDVDDVREWIGDVTGKLLINPYTTQSEIRTVTDANYDTDANSTTLTASANITVAGFAGCDGNNTPATATLTVTAVNSGVTSNFALDGTQIDFTGGTGDTTDTLAIFIYSTINAHPKLKRKFIATVSGSVVTINSKIGTLIFDSAVVNAQSAPLANPTTAPTLAESAAAGSLQAGLYHVAYSYVNARGQTLLSKYKAITIVADKDIDVTAITPLPAGVTSVNWYVSPGPSSDRLRLHSNNDGSAFTISSLPLLTSTLPPELNRTGAEVMRVRAVFSDRAETRGDVTRSNVLRATYKWLLSTREKSINRIDLKFRDASDDFRLIELRLKDLDHIAKVKKEEAEEVNGQAINNVYQAVRIASSMLAERMDANFWYEWESTREALLLEEGDVVAIIDDGSGVVNLPVFITGISFSLSTAGLPSVSFTAQKYSSTLYDDSIAERVIPVILG